MSQGIGRYIMHLYCFAVQADFSSDVVECSTLDRRVPGSIIGRGMEVSLRVRDNLNPSSRLLRLYLNSTTSLLNEEILLR